MEPTKRQVTRLGYCQYLLVSQINYTLTNFADNSGDYFYVALGDTTGEVHTIDLDSDNCFGISKIGVNIWVYFLDKSSNERQL